METGWELSQNLKNGLRVKMGLLHLEARLQDTAAGISQMFEFPMEGPGCKIVRARVSGSGDAEQAGEAPFFLF